MVARLLLRFLRGPGSEYLRGDLEEWWNEEQRRRTTGRRRSFELEVLRSLAAWWRPSALARRSLAGRARTSGASHELRLAVRGLSRRPGYTALIVAVIGIGIGTTTTVLTVVDQVLVRSLPFPEARRLAFIGSTFPDREWREDAPGLQHLAGFSLANFVEWEARVRTFERLGALERMGVLLPDEGSGPELVQGAAVTPEFLDILEVRPALGRLFLPDEYRTTAEAVVMLSHEEWRTRYGSDPGVLGAALSSEEGGAVIVGVLPPGFEVPEAVATENFRLWFPIRVDSERYASRGRRSLSGIGLLRRGATISQARAEMDRLAQQLAAEFPEGNVYPDGRRLGAGANALQAHTIGSARGPIVLFMGAALLLLLISGLNTGNLTLVRGLAREREVRVRRALGASRSSLVRLFVVEALVVAGLGGALGLGLAAAGVAMFRRLAPASIPRMSEVILDLRIALLALAITALAGLVTGLLPALRLTRGAGEAPRVQSLRRVGTRPGVLPLTVTTQVALSMFLMVAAGLLMESFIRLRAVDPGFDGSSALTFQQSVKSPDSRDQPAYLAWDDLIAGVRELPTVTRVAAASNLPFQSPSWAPWVLLPTDLDDHHRTGVAGYVVSDQYFETLGIPLKGGRAFGRGDGPESQAVVIVNEAFLDSFVPEWAGTEVLGTMIRLRQGDDLREKQIVGIVGNVVQTRPEEGMGPAVYVPHRQEDWPAAWVFARTADDPLAEVDRVRTIAAEVNPYVPPRQIATMDDRIGRTRSSPRFNAALTMAFGLVSLLLAAGGLYGALSFTVGRRSHEIGVRLALGATRSSVMGLVLSQGLRVTLTGVFVGLVGALAGGRLLRSFLFEVEPTSLPAIGVVTATLLGVAALASLAPALRATRVDPVGSLNVD